MSDTVLVTGASGFVGSAVARALLARGYAVRALVRPSSPRGNLEGLGVSLVEGDLTRPETLAPAVAGARHLFHVAADYRLWAKDPAELIRANVEGTEALMRAALAAGVERIVYTSSVATLSLKGVPPVDEGSPAAEDEPTGVYKRSKTVAERRVEALVRDHGLPAVIVNPSTPIGPRDIKPTPTGRVIVEAAAGRMPAYVDTGLNLAHVDDVAAGHLLALDRGVVGQRYILGGEDVSLRTMLHDIAALSGRRPPKVELPRGPLYPLAAVAEAVAQVTGKEPFLTRDALDMSKHHMFFTSARAERELGYRARPYREALADALAWFRQHGYVR